VKRIFLLIVLLLTPICLHGQTARPKPPFPVFDATIMTQKPDLKDFGLKPITVVYPNFMWEGNKVPDTTSLPDSSRINAFARLLNQTTDIVVIDIEHWPVTGDAATVNDSLKKYQTVLKWFKSPAPSLKVGLYGVLPIRNYWDAIQNTDSARYTSWQKDNDRLAPLAQSTDVLFPSIYTFYEDRNGWRKYAIAQIQEARRQADGKPVYVFLWPQFHGSNKTLANTFLPGDYWRMELETARQYADGIVIWCCSNRQTWDGSAPWWLETQKFIKEAPSQKQ